MPKQHFPEYIPGQWAKLKTWNICSPFIVLLQPITKDTRNDGWWYQVVTIKESAEILINKHGVISNCKTSTYYLDSYIGIQVYRATLRDIAIILTAHNACDHLPRLQNFKPLYEKRGVTIDENNNVITLHQYIDDYVRNNSEFTQLPQYFPKKHGTGVHFSTLNPTLFAYYPDNKSIIAKRATQIRPGRYIKKYFSKEYSDDKVRILVASLIGSVRLRIAKTFDEMYEVYRTLHKKGIVTSCMSSDDWNGELEYHPLQVYHNSDVALAVMEDLQDNPLARALFNVNTMEYPIIYGYWEKMEKLLEQNGFKHGSLEGAKINFIWKAEPNEIVMPYIDGNRPNHRGEYNSDNIDVDITNETITITSRGNYNCSETDGSIAINATVCCCCGDSVHSDNGYYDAYEAIYCEYCFVNHTTSVIVGHYRNTEQYPDNNLPNDLIYIEGEDFPIINSYIAERLGYVFSGYLDEWVDQDDVVWDEKREDWVYEEDLEIEEEEDE